MRFVRIYPALPIASLLIAAFARSPRQKPSLDGNYQCVRLEFHGQSLPCRARPLVLNRDGSYEIWGERGTYEVVQGNWLVLSHSKRRGLGHFVNSHDIVFEYRVDGRVCRVTLRRVLSSASGLLVNSRRPQILNRSL